MRPVTLKTGIQAKATRSLGNLPCAPDRKGCLLPLALSAHVCGDVTPLLLLPLLLLRDFPGRGGTGGGGAPAAAASMAGEKKA